MEILHDYESRNLKVFSETNGLKTKIVACDNDLFIRDHWNIDFFLFNEQGGGASYFFSSRKLFFFSRLILSFMLMTYAAIDNTKIAPASAKTRNASISLLCITISRHSAVMAIMIGKVTGIRLVL